MDYSNYQNNGYANYQMQQPVKKKRDVKGIIITIMCLATSVVVALSTLMPMMSIDYRYDSVGVNIVDIIKGIFKVFDMNWDILEGWQVFVMILLVIVLFLPVVTSIIGIITTFVYGIKLIVMKPVKRVNGFAKTILVLEMIFAAFMYVDFYVVINLSELSGRYLSGATLSIGWYLPVILSFAIILLRFVFDAVDKVKKDGKTKENIIAITFGIMIAVFAMFMYMAFGFAQYSAVEDSSSVYLYASFLQINMLSDFSELCVLVWVFIVVITLLSQILFTRSLKQALKAKASAVLAIVTGIIAIIFSIVNYILFVMYVEEEMSRGMSESLSMSTASYIYIIMGVLLIFAGIACLCTRATVKKGQPAAYYQQAPVQQNMNYYQQPMAQQDMNYYQQPMAQQNMNYYQQPTSQQDMVYYQPPTEQQNQAYYNQQNMQQAEYYNQQNNSNQNF